MSGLREAENKRGRECEGEMKRERYVEWKRDGRRKERPRTYRPQRRRAGGSRE